MDNSSVSFSSAKTEFIRELRTQVDEYFKNANKSPNGDIRVLLQSAFMMALYAGPYFLMVFGIIQAPFLILISWVIMGFGMAGLGMVLMHDANHGSLSGKHTINRLMGKSLYLLGGFPPTWRQQHNTLHHGYTNIDGFDEDISPIGILRLNPHNKLRKIHRFQHIYAWLLYGLMTLSWVTMKDFKQLKNYSRKNFHLSSHKNINSLMADLILSKILYHLVFLVIPIIVLPIPWYLTVLFFIIMHFVSGVTLGTIFQAAHVVPTSDFPLPDDEGNIENNWAVHQVKTTSDFAPKNKVLSWLIGGLNFQVEHHLFPNISHVHYKRISSIVRNIAEKYSLNYHVQPDFISAIGAHYKMLKHLGKNASALA